MHIIFYAGPMKDSSKTCTQDVQEYQVIKNKTPKQTLK